MKESLLFAGQTLRRWRTIGAVLPTSRALCRAMARGAGPVAAGQVVVEIGAGTGVVTEELVAMYPQARIVAVELLDPLADLLAAKFPTVEVVHGDAARLPDLLADRGITPADVAAVVSGLPLLSLPGDLPQRVLAATAAALPAGRPYVQLTYSARAWQNIPTPGFERVGRTRVWKNVPPGWALHFRRAG